MISIMMDTAIKEIADTKPEPKKDVFARLATKAAVEVMLMSPDEIDVAIEGMNLQYPRTEVDS